MKTTKLQNIFNKATNNGKVVGLANILLEQCTADKNCPCIALLSMSRDKIEDGHDEYWKDKDNREYQDIDKTWEYVWFGTNCNAGECESFELSELKFLDMDDTNTIPAVSEDTLKSVVEKALAKTDWKKSEVWQLCSLYDLIKKREGVLAFENLSLCVGCAATIEQWATNLCNLACDIFWEGYEEVEDSKVSEDGWYQFIDFDNRYATNIPMMFYKAVLQKLGMSAYDGKKLTNCVDKLTISYDDYNETNRYGLKKAAGVGIYEAFKLATKPGCIPMSSPYRTENLRLDELDHPTSKRYRGETNNTPTTVRETWDCGEGQCYDPQNGKGMYTSLDACQTNCTESSEINPDYVVPKKSKSKSTSDWW